MGEIAFGYSHRKCNDWLSFLGITGAVWVINMAHNKLQSIFFSSEILHESLRSKWNLVLLLHWERAKCAKSIHEGNKIKLLKESLRL